MREIDLDGVATARPLAEVVEAMVPWLSQRHANPDSRHYRGAAASCAVEAARGEVAALVGARTEEIVFTSGATEANNTALRGAARLIRERRVGPVGVPAHEHPSLLHPARTLAREGFDVEEIPVGRDGRIDPDSLGGAPLGLLALSHAHAELGTVQPAALLAETVEVRGGLVLLDATLTAGRLPSDVPGPARPALLTLSFHHLGGPAGVGALVLRGDLPIAPLLEGGTQERGYRAGTPNLAGIVGAGVAARLAARTAGERAARLGRLGRLLHQELLRRPGVRTNGPGLEHRLPGHVSVQVEGVEGGALVTALQDRGVLAATGSPCADVAGAPSAALLAAGYTRQEARRSVLFAVPPTGGPDEPGIREALAAFDSAVARLRALGGGMPGGMAPPRG